MDAAALLRRNELDAALNKLLDQVRADPADAKLRIFLFQLFCVTGDWDRAKTQLEVIAGLDKEALMMVRIYGDALDCEGERRRVFAGEKAPTIFGEPLPWIAELCEALRLEARSEHAAASDLRARAFEAAPATPGRVDGQVFAWLGDADSRLGPVLETIINGRYVWLPFMRLARLTIEPPTDLRDQVWMPVKLFLTNGGETVGLVPTRYCDSEHSSDPLIRLGRKTEWIEFAADAFKGLGQRLLTTDAGDFPLMDIRSIEWEHAAALREGAVDG